MFNNIIEHYLPWWFDCISGIKTVIESIITYWFTLRDVFFIIVGILLGIFIYRLRIGKNITKVEKILLKAGDIFKIIYKTILNLTIKPLIICAVFVCIFITCLGIYALISISCQFWGFFIPTIVIIISAIVSIVIFKVRKEKRRDKREIFRFLKDIFF